MTSALGRPLAGAPELAEALLDVTRDSPSAARLHEAMAHLRSGARSFDWLHLGKCDVRIRDLIGVLRRAPAMSPPRTGHIGDWSDIAAGRSGLLDYNRTICADLGIGAALLFDTTRTENDKLDAGDCIYVPGSLVDHGRRQRLPLLARRAGQLVELDRARSWFVPFVLTRHEGELRLLSDLHRSRNSRLAMPLGYVSARLLSDRAALDAALRSVLATALTHPRSATLTHALFAGVVGTDGEELEARVEAASPAAFAVAGERLSADEMRQRVLLPTLTMNDPDVGAAHLAGPAELAVPLMSNLLLTLLLVLLRSHVTAPEATPRPPFDVHLHWGAIGMAGFPPVSRGYFEGGEYARRLRPFFDAAVQPPFEASPTLFVVAPAALFALLPRECWPEDVRLVRELCEAVRAALRPAHGDGREVEIVREVVGAWWTRRRGPC